MSDDDAPELTDEFFANAVLTQPGDDLVAVMRKHRPDTADRLVALDKWRDELTKRWTYGEAKQALADIRAWDHQGVPLARCPWFAELVAACPFEGQGPGVAVNIARERIIDAFEAELRKLRKRY